MARTIGFAICLAVVAGIVLYVHETSQPKTAGDMGIGLMSQYQLAELIYDNAEQVALMRLEDSDAAMRLAHRNYRLASFITDWSAYCGLKQVAAQEWAMFSEAGISWGGVEAELSVWQERLHPREYYSLYDLDAGWMRKMPDDIMNMDWMRRGPYLVSTNPDMALRSTENEKLRRQVNTRLHVAEAEAEQAAVITKQTGDPVPDWVARALLCKAQADWMLLVELRIFGRSMDPPVRVRLEAHCLKLVKLANSYVANNYQNKVDPALACKVN